MTIPTSHIRDHDMTTSAFDSLDQENINRKIAFGFERIAQVLKTLIWVESKDSGLSPIQIQFLILLLYNTHREWTVSDLAAYFQLTPATVSDALTALEGKNLIVRRHDAEDRRVSLLTLTPAGKRKAAKLSGWMNAIQDVVSALDGADKITVLKSLIGIVAALQERGLISQVQMCLTCKFFRANVHPGKPKPHHCAYVDKPLGNADLRIDCPDYDTREVEA